MPILSKFQKQPADRQDYDIDFRPWLSGFTPVDTITGTPVVVADAGITVDQVQLSAGVVKVWVSGGTTDTSYKLTCTATTAGGRVKQVEVIIKVKED